jgi:hypothetical protein
VSLKFRSFQSKLHQPVPPNKHMQRAGRHKVLGRGRPSLVSWLAHRARVLTGRRAGADVNRWATGRA